MWRRRPRAIAWKRQITRFLPTKASATTSSLTSRPWLFSALATADITHFLTSWAMRFLENSRSDSAVSTFLPRIICATRLSFCGDTRRFLATAWAWLSGSLRSRLGLPILFPLHRFAVATVAMEGPARRELAELVADHVLGHVHRHVLLAVVDAERQPDELRQDGRAPAPDLDDLVATGRARLIRLLEQIAVDERAFPD